LTVAIDTVAASGGYMMACVASHIVAAPFAMVGSIGVVGQVPNVSRTLERGGVEVVQRTAGQYKRTVNVAVPNTEAGLAKFEEDFEVIQTSFREWVGVHRPKLDLNEVCTGEVWLATNALPLGLVDEIATCDSYLRTRQQSAKVLVLEPIEKKKARGLAAVLERLADATASLRTALWPIDKAANAVVSAAQVVTPAPLLRAPAGGVLGDGIQARLDR